VWISARGEKFDRACHCATNRFPINFFPHFNDLISTRTFSCYRADLPRGVNCVAWWVIPIQESSVTKESLRRFFKILFKQHTSLLFTYLKLVIWMSGSDSCCIIDTIVLAMEWSFWDGGGSEAGSVVSAQRTTKSTRAQLTKALERLPPGRCFRLRASSILYSDSSLVNHSASFLDC